MQISRADRQTSHVNSHTPHTQVNASRTDLITVFEHQRLTVHDFARVSDFHWLMAQEFSVFTIKRKQKRWQLKVGHYIGVILLPSGMTLEILPKLLISNENRHSQHQLQSYTATQTVTIGRTRQWVQQMLSDLTNSNDTSHGKLPNTKQLGQMSHQLAPSSIAALPLSEWLIEQFVQRLTHYQPIKNYQSQIRNQSSLQGRLLIKEQLRCNSMQPHKFVCESSVLNQNMLGNRLIKSALLLLTPLFAQVLYPKFMQAWQQIPTLTAHEKQQLTSIYQRAKRELMIQPLSTQQLQAAQQLLDLSYWLLQQTKIPTGHGIDPQDGCKKTVSQLRLCLLIDMNQAFEQWASQRIAATFTQMSCQYRPLYQTQRVWLSDEAGQACLSIRPDLLIYKASSDTEYQACIRDTSSARASGSYSHVIDIKWKHLSHAAAISASDAYQLTSYAQAYQAGQVWLVYPVQDEERQPVALKQAIYHKSHNDSHKENSHNKNSRDSENVDDEPSQAQLWLMPFNVLTGTINSGLLPT
ncbi:hypothetical protein AAJP47_05635 [Psychrobacter sp. B38]|uniref:McrC family protein n=1 Tax=Psychrobacter sp. B38 TaxID=3143538 RepID=UPI00320CF16A